jgi:hypothetical protein
MSEKTNFLLWQPLNLALGLVVSLFVVAVAYDFRDYSVSKKLVIAMLFAGIVFYAVTLFIPGAFIVFIIYEALAMLFALIIYSMLAIKKKLKGAWIMSAGILVTMIAAGIQASESVLVKVIWQFDHNGVFHLVQMIGIVLLLSGLLAEFNDRAKKA